MAWHNASLPLEAVTAGGRLSVNSGSTRVTRANQSSVRMLALNCREGSLSTAFLVTSAPLPAVVGMVIRGRPGPSISRP